MQGEGVGNKSVSLVACCLFVCHGEYVQPTVLGCKVGDDEVEQSISFLFFPSSFHGSNYKK